jgi:hypothetical protein
MLRSKFPRPWQPHVSDSRILNPAVHGSEREFSLSEEIEEIEEAESDAHPPAVSQSAVAASSDFAKEFDLETTSALTAQTAGKSARRYTAWIQRLIRH